MDPELKEKLLKKIDTLQREKVRLSRALVEHRIINETFKDINSTLDLDTVLRKIMARVKFCMEAEISTVMLLDAEEGELFVAAAEGMDDEAAGDVALPLGEGIAGWVAEKGEPVLVTDVEKDFRFDQREGGMRHGTRSLVCAPLISKGSVLGVVTADRPAGSPPFAEADLELLVNISNQAAVCIENARLFARLRERRLSEDAE